MTNTIKSIHWAVQFLTLAWMDAYTDTIPTLTFRSFLTVSRSPRSPTALTVTVSCPIALGLSLRLKGALLPRVTVNTPLSGRLLSTMSRSLSTVTDTVAYLVKSRCSRQKQSTVKKTHIQLTQM